MRNLILPASFLFIATASSAQDNTLGMRQEFQNITGFGQRQTGFEGIQTYSNHQVTGSPYFTDNWARGSVTSIINQTISNGYVFLYDKVKQDLFFKAADSNISFVADKNQVKTFTISTDKAHVFFPASQYDPALKDNFIEVIVQNDKYSLLKITRTTFEKSNPNDMIKMKQGDFSDRYVDHVTYYIYHNKELKKLTALKEGSLRRLLKDESAKVDAFFNRYENNELDEELLITLINSLN